MTRRPRLRKAFRIAGYAAAGLVALVVVIAVGAPIYFRGARFGALVEGVLPEMRGHVHVGGGRWSWGTVIALVRQQPAPLALEDLTITDPEGTEVLHIDQLSARIEVRRRPTHIIVHDLLVKNARWRFANMKGARKVGFLTALESLPHGARKPSKKPAGAELSVDGARLDGVEVTFDLPTWGLVLHDAHAIGAIGFKAKTFTFEVKDVDVRGGGELRVLSPKNGVIWPFERGRIDRVATTADAPDNIRLDASNVVNGTSRTAGGGVFTGIYNLTPLSKHPGIELEAHMADAADAVNAIIARRGLAGRVKVGGAGADLRLRFQRPFDSLAVEAELRGFDVTSGEIEARKVGCHLTAEPMVGRFNLERLSLASPGGGHIDAKATLERLQLDATVDATHFAARPLLPAALRPFAGGTIDGMLHARVDLLGGDAELVRSTLVVRRTDDDDGGAITVALAAGKSVRPPAGATVLRLTGARLVDGVLRLPRLTLSMWGGTFAAEGRIALWDPDKRHWLSPVRLDLTLQGSGLQIERLLGTGFARGALSFRAHVQGTTEDLALGMTFVDPRVITVLGESVRLPASAELHLKDSTLDLGNLPLGGPGDSALIASGRIGLTGRLAIDVGVVRYPIARLPGLSGTSLPVGGSISGNVRMVGKPQAPALSGQFTLAGVTFAKTSLGGGTIDITPERKGAVRARGHLVDAIAIDGRLAPQAAGLEGELTLVLTRLPLDPFLPALPGMKMGGFVSGTGVARIAPGAPVTAEAKLSELALSLASSDARGRPLPPIDVRADNEIVARVRGGDGLSLSPARFRSGVGWIELAGETHGDQQHASVRGHLELGAAAPFARQWFKTLAGSLEVDLTADGRGVGDDVAVSGTVAVATPVSLKLAAFPVDASIPSGRMRLTKNVLDTSGLPVVLHAERLPIPAVSRVDARVRVSGRIDGNDNRGRFGARVALDAVDVTAPLIGRKPVRSAGGEIVVAGEAGTGKFEVTQIDLPVNAEAEGLTAAPGATVDRALIAVRVRGNQRQLALSGDVEVGSAHVRADALTKKGGGGSGKRGPLADHPEIEGARLDVRLRSHGGAIHVDVNNLPDLRVDVDMHVGGTVKKPSLTGTQHGANLWSSFVLALVRLFS